MTQAATGASGLACTAPPRAQQALCGARSLTPHVQPRLQALHAAQGRPDLAWRRRPRWSAWNAGPAAGRRTSCMRACRRAPCRLIARPRGGPPCPAGRRGRRRAARPWRRARAPHAARRRSPRRAPPRPPRARRARAAQASWRMRPARWRGCGAPWRPHVRCAARAARQHASRSRARQDACVTGSRQRLRAHHPCSWGRPGPAHYGARVAARRAVRPRRVWRRPACIRASLDSRRPRGLPALHRTGAPEPTLPLLRRSWPAARSPPGVLCPGFPA